MDFTPLRMLASDGVVYSKCLTGFLFLALKRENQSLRIGLDAVRDRGMTFNTKAKV
jgi:hypothetical protein